MEQGHARALMKSARHALFGAFAVALLTFFCFRVHLDLASAIPLYLLVVVLQSLTGDFRSSAIVAVLSTGCLDFFFTEPLFSLRMANPLNALALLAFLVTALVITKLVSRVRQEAESSRLQKERLSRLYKLFHQLLTLEPTTVLREIPGAISPALWRHGGVHFRRWRRGTPYGW
jgi:two-component system sensor histidine kinase KdpD